MILPMKTQTQEQIAGAAGLSQPTISLILCEKRNPSWDAAKALAKALNRKPAEIMEDAPGCIRRALDGNT